MKDLKEQTDLPQSLNVVTVKTGKAADAYRWVILALNIGIQALSSCVTTATSTLAPFIVADLGLTKAMMGFAGGSVNMGMSFTAILAGRIADKKGERTVLLIGSTFASLAIILASRVNSFVPLVAALLFTGAFCSAPTPSGSKAITKWFPPAQIGFALGLRQTGIPIGGFLGALLLPYIALNWGWRAAMTTAGIILFCGGLVCYSLYKEHPQTLENKKNGKPKKTGEEWAFLRIHSFWYAQVTSIVFLGAQYVLLTYLVLFLNDTAGISIKLASFCLAISQLGGIFARIVLGKVSDSFLKGARTPAFIFEGFLLIGTLLILSTFNSTTPFWMAVIAAWFFGMSAMGWNGIHIALVMKLAKKEQGGAAVGVTISAMQLGVLLIPPMFGYLIDISGSYRLSFLILSFVTLLATLLLFKVREPKLAE